MTPAGRWRRWRRLPGVLLAAAGGVPLGLFAYWVRRDWGLAAWSRLTARALGLVVEREGPAPPPGCLVVANHVGYLDILALGAAVPGAFLAKAEIAGWPFLGTLARWGGTVFVDRDRPRGSRPLVQTLAARLGARDRVLLFPEAGVSPDGVGVGEFRPMLFEAAVAAGCPVTPVALCYREPRDPRVWAWIDEPNLWRHLWTRVLPAPRLRVVVRCGAPLTGEPGGGRKDLAARARRAVAALLEEGGPP